MARYLNDSYRLCDRRGFGTWPPTQPRQTPLRIKGNLVVTNDSFVYTHVTHRAHHRIIEGSTRRCPKIENQILPLDLSRFQSTVRNLPRYFIRDKQAIFISIGRNNWIIPSGIIRITIMPMNLCYSLNYDRWAYGCVPWIALPTLYPRLRKCLTNGKFIRAIWQWQMDDSEVSRLKRLFEKVPRPR